MLRKMDDTMSTLKLLKVLATTNIPPSPEENDVEVRLYHFCSWLNNFDESVARGGAKTAGQAFCG